MNTNASLGRTPLRGTEQRMTPDDVNLNAPELSTSFPVQTREGQSVVQRAQAALSEEIVLPEEGVSVTDREVRPFPISEEIFKPHQSPKSFPVSNFVKFPEDSTCFISSTLQFLGMMLDDDFLNRLAGARKRYQEKLRDAREPDEVQGDSFGCPEYLLSGKEGEDREAVIQTWLHFSETFCEGMQLLRQVPADDGLIPNGYMNCFIQRLGRLGQAVGDNEPVVNYLLGNADNTAEVSQMDAAELYRLLANILGFKADEYHWKGAIKLENIRTIFDDGPDGLLVTVPRAKEPLLPEAYYQTPLPYPAPGCFPVYFEQCLSPVDSKEEVKVNGADVRSAYVKLRTSIGSGTVTVDNQERTIRKIDEKLETFKVKPGYLQKTSTRVHVKPDCDSMVFCLSAFARESDMMPGYYDLQKQNDGVIPEELSFGTTGDKYMRDKSTNINYLVKQTPIGGTGASEKQAAQHFQASCLGRRFYEMAGIKVLSNVCVRKKYSSNETKYISLTEDRLDKRGQRVDCRPEFVSSVLTSKNWVGKGNIVFDAWLGNTDILNGRPGGLGVMPVDIFNPQDPDSPPVGTTDELCRTEFECFGYKYQKAEPEPFTFSAQADLVKLCEAEPFKYSGITRQDIEHGKLLLKKMDNDAIEGTVRDSGVDIKHHNELIEKLKSRRDSIINMEVLDDTWSQKSYQTLGENVENIKFQAWSDSRKLTKRAIRALDSTKGTINLSVTEEGREKEFVGKVKSILCHSGQGTSEGHYITLHRFHETWFVTDDMYAAETKPVGGEEVERTPLGAVPVRTYIHSQYGKDCKLASPNGFNDVIYLLKNSGGKLAPYLVGFERDIADSEKRAQWQQDYEKKAVDAYRAAHPQHFPIEDVPSSSVPESPEKRTEDMDVTQISEDLQNVGGSESSLPEGSSPESSSPVREAKETLGPQFGRAVIQQVADDNRAKVGKVVQPDQDQGLSHSQPAVHQAGSVTASQLAGVRAASTFAIRHSGTEDPVSTQNRSDIPSSGAGGLRRGDLEMDPEDQARLQIIKKRKLHNKLS